MNQEATLSLWLYYEAQATSDYYSLAEKGDPERDGHSRWGLWIRDDVAELCIEPNEPNPIQRCLDGTVGLVPDGWNHVAGTYDGATLRLTINGALAGEQKGSPALIAQSNHNLQLGADLYQARPVYLKCILDDIRIYRRALADEEIVQLFDVQP